MEKSEYFPRDILDTLKKWLDRREIYAIKGPRQSGKTTILKILINYLIKEHRVNPGRIVFLTFEDRDVLDKFSADPKAFVRSFVGENNAETFYFFIDEFHYLVDGGQKLKLLYDLYENIKFIITGSSSLELKGKTGKYLVGRMFSFNLYQLNFAEFLKIKSEQLSNVYREWTRQVWDFITDGKGFQFQKDIFLNDFQKLYEEYALFGGYPEVAKTQDIETRKVILKNIYDTYIARDIIELLRIRESSNLRVILGFLAGQTGSLLNYTNLANDSKTYFKEVKHCLSVLEETFIIDLIKPFSRNKSTELKKNPKIYFIDTGFRNYLLQNFNSLTYRPDSGQIIENLIFTQLKKKNVDSIRYWRTLAGAEVAFILEAGGMLIPIEVKYSLLNKEKISRGFRNFISEYKPQRGLVLTRNLWGELKIEKTLVKFIPLFYL